MEPVISEQVDGEARVAGQHSAFRKPLPPLSHSKPGLSPKHKTQSGPRRRDQREHNSELELPSYDRLPIRPELQRPDSVITTSSVVSSEAASVVEEAEEKLSCVPPPAPPSVYTISGLYGSSPTSREPESSKDQTRTHKRSASTMATSIVIRGCQKTHKRSHSHTVGSGQPYQPHHRRTGSSGFVRTHRRATSGASAIVDTLEKITGGSSRTDLQSTICALPCVCSVRLQVSLGSPSQVGGQLDIASPF